MMRRIGSAVLVAGIAIAMQLPSQAAETKKPDVSPKTEAKKAPAPKPQTQLVTESEFSHWLVQVLGLSRFVSAAPSDQECFTILLQNGIKPKDGWNSTNVVTRGTLARVTVQSMGKTSEVKDPTKDEAYIDYLKSVGIEIGTIGEAVEKLQVLDEPLANEAIVTTTDPLGKIHHMRPVDEQQMGADLAPVNTRALTAAEEPVPPATITKVFHHEHNNPPPLTPN